MEEERIGFIGIVIEDLAQAARVNQVISQYQALVTGRIAGREAAALDMRKHYSYAPYSHYHVGAALMGKVFR